jgi:hypothetical protein
VRFADNFLGDGEDALRRKKDAVQGDEVHLHPGKKALRHGIGGFYDREIVLMTKTIFLMIKTTVSGTEKMLSAFEKIFFVIQKIFSIIQ